MMHLTACYDSIVSYEWDPDNVKKEHGVSFGEAASVLLDPNALTYDDPDHSEDELREITIGTSATAGRLLFVTHCWRRNRVRIISARKATRREAETICEKNSGTTNHERKDAT